MDALLVLPLTLLVLAIQAFSMTHRHQAVSPVPMINVFSATLLMVKAVPSAWKIMRWKTAKMK